MKEQELTRWFSTRTKPKQVGVYMIDWCDGGTYYSYWDGKIFNGGWSNAEQAHFRRFFGRSILGNPKRWRGLAQDPSKQ